MRGNKLWRRLRVLALRKVLHADDSAHRIALGVAVALFVAWTPTIGIQMFLGLAVAALVGANKAVTLPVVWVTNWATVVPIYYFNWLVGQVLLHGRLQHDASIRDTMGRLFRNREGHVVVFERFVQGDFWEHLRQAMVTFGVELWVGSLVVGLVLALASYLPARWLVNWYRHRRFLHRERKRARRAARLATDASNS